jgi:hypothetical protein
MVSTCIFYVQWDLQLIYPFNCREGSDLFATNPAEGMVQLLALMKKSSELRKSRTMLVTFDSYVPYIPSALWDRLELVSFQTSSLLLFAVHIVCILMVRQIQTFRHAHFRYDMDDLFPKQLVQLYAYKQIYSTVDQTNQANESVF